MFTDISSSIQMPSMTRFPTTVSNHEIKHDGGRRRRLHKIKHGGGPLRGLHEIAYGRGSRKDFTRSDRAAPGERPDSTPTTRAAPSLQLEHKHSFLDRVIMRIEYVYVGCLTFFLLGFLVSTSLPPFLDYREILLCFGSWELSSYVYWELGDLVEPTTE